jgi:glutamate/aspartate transport system substrate-binding protein
MWKKLGLLTAAACLLAPAASAQDLYGTLKKIKDTGTIVIGHREASVPFAYIGPDGKPIGYTLDICAKIVERIKSELKLDKLEVKYVPTNPQTRIPLVVNGTIDIECGSTTNNLTRAKQIDYLHVTFITGTKLLVRKGSGIKEVEDLGGKKIALVLGTTNEKAVKAVAEKKNIKLDVHPVKDYPQALLELESNRVDAVASDDILLAGVRASSKTPQAFEVVGRYLSYDPYGIMVRRDDSAFRLLGNTVISDLMRSGEIVDIYNKWFFKPPGKEPLDWPLSDTLKTAFEIQALPY